MDHQERRDGSSSKRRPSLKESKAHPKPQSKLKERWLLTRKTWRYMSDAGKKIFPEGADPHKVEDVPKFEEHFQSISRRAKEFILWPGPRQKVTYRKRDKPPPLPEPSEGYSEEGESESDRTKSSLPSPSYVSSCQGSLRSRFFSSGDLDWTITPEMYQHLVKTYGSSTLHHVASRLLEEQFTEEDEFYCDEEDTELIEVDGRPMRSVGAQTDPYLDMCVQTDHDSTAEDFVNVGAETREETEAAVALERAKAALDDESKHQQLQREHQHSAAKNTHGGSVFAEKSGLKKLFSRRESTCKSDSQSQPKIGEQEKTSKGLASEKDREAPPPKGGVAAKLASLEAAAQQSGAAQPLQFAKQQKQQQDKKTAKNVFKLGLKCDIDSTGAVQKKVVEKTKTDKFKTVNYDKTLRNIKSKWVPSAEEDKLLEEYSASIAKGLERKLSEKEKVKKKKARSIQVGDPLPQFILSSFRINCPVEIIHATKRRLRRLSSKADSTEFSESECSAPPSQPLSPRYSIVVSDEHGAQDVHVSEVDLFRLTQMGIPFTFKRFHTDSSAEGDAEAPCPTEQGAGLPRSISSSLLSQMLYNVRSARSGHQHSSSGLGGISVGVSSLPRSTHSLLQSLLPAVMQRGRSSAAGHTSRLVAKHIWRTRSKSQSRASAGTTSVWTPMGNCTWMSVTGRVVPLEQTCLLNLTELERLAFQKVVFQKIQALNLGCPVKIPRDAACSSAHKKRRPYLLKRKALSTGFFETKKEPTKENSAGGLVFGLSLSRCLENERNRAIEREAAIASAAASEEGEGQTSRKSSHAGSHASFSSLIEGMKPSSSGSLESLNLERKRPSLGSVAETLGPNIPSTLDLLTVDTQPQVPTLVSRCFKHLQKHGLRTLGIFRVSSSKKRVRQLREEFDKGKDVQLGEEHCPHDVATLLKDFFRDLPEPLLTKELYEPLIRTQKVRNRTLQFEAMQYLIQLLPPANRDTLYYLLNFLTVVAENAVDSTSKTGDILPGNKMDSSNLATLFAPNILRSSEQKDELPSTSEMAAHAQERIDVISVVRSMIDHNKDLFEVSPELLDEVYQHLMDSHPEALDILLRRRCTGPDDPDLEVDTSSSVFEGSDASSPLPRSPTEVLESDRRRLEEEDVARGRIREKRATVYEPHEEKSWFRRRDKSGSREKEKTEDIHEPERSRWFRRKDRTSPRGSFDKSFSRQASEKHMHESVKVSSQSVARTSGGRTDSHLKLESVEDKSSSGEGRKIISGETIVTNQERLRVPEPSVRRLSSPELENCGVITASLKIPIPLQQQQPSLSLAQDTGILGTTEPTVSEEAKTRLKEGTKNSSRQRTGSNDSYLGQPITGTMSFQPLSKKEGDKESHDSVLSSSSADVFTVSPSARNTPSSDNLFASGTSSPLSGAVSPPFWLSPDSGTPGLSPPNSPPPPPRRFRRRDSIKDAKEEAPGWRPGTLIHSATHTFGHATSSTPQTKDKGLPKTGAVPLGRSRTSDALKIEQYFSSMAQEVQEEKSRVRRRDQKEEEQKKKVSIPSTSSSSSSGKDKGKPYARRKYADERRQASQLPDLSQEGRTREGSAQLWKRWEIIASDPGEPETFV